MTTPNPDRRIGEERPERPSTEWEHDGDLDAVLRHLLECCHCWAPQARLIGNARACDMMSLLAQIPHLRAQLAEAAQLSHQYRNERDAAQARVGEMEGLLRECLPWLKFKTDLADRIDAALATSPHRLAGRE